MSKLLIITLSTAGYNKYVTELFKSLKKAFKGEFDVRDVCWITDRSDDDCIQTFVDNAKGMDTLGTMGIVHMPWPIVTCLKFDFVRQILQDEQFQDYDYVLYLDSVMRIRKELHLQDFMLDKVNVWEHFLWDFMSDSERRFLHNERKNTYSYIKEEDRYEYVHAGMFFGRIDMIKSLCIEVQELMNKELRNGILPQWHDESCLNYVYHQLSDNFNVISSQVYDEGAPNRYVRPIEDYQLSFENCTDCQEIKKV